MLKQRIGVFIILLIISIAFGYYIFKSQPPSPPSHKQSFAHNAYWFSWAQDNPQFIYSNLCHVPDGIDTVFVAFALHNPSNNELELQLRKKKSFQHAVTQLQNRGIKVVISSGGASGLYPWLNTKVDIATIVQQYLTLVDLYHFSGIDFDIEQGDTVRLTQLILQLKKLRPSLGISLTLPTRSQGLEPNHLQLAQTLFQRQALNFINLMNYNHGINDQPDSCLSANQPVISSCYASALFRVLQQVQSIGMSAQQAKKMIYNGLMIGYSDTGERLSLNNFKRVQDWTAQQGFAGVFIWGLNRDQSRCGTEKNLDVTTGLNGVAQGAFVNEMVTNPMLN